MSDLSVIDLAAIIWFLIANIGYSWVTRHGPLADKGLSPAMKKARLAWMETMAVRDIRMVDTQILANLSHGNAFFASTAVIIVGGLATLLGASDNIKGVIEHIPFASPLTPWVWNAKILFVMAVFVTAFFKFAWAFRLSHYTSILLGATPVYEGDNKALCSRHAKRAAELASLAGYHANAGLRSYYFGIAALCWLLNSVLFICATALVLAVLFRREYLSRAFKTLTDWQQ